ncbi:MAG: RagB/SusD family nutrient uptake outer membrane protein, partial [Prolixibacteraceae bacterium]
LHYEDSWQANGRQKYKYNIVYRMAEVYLNYAEAMNELDQSYTIGDVTVFRDETEIRRCFNLIRYRAGLPGITAADAADPQRMRELIERERQIEMAWENRRYFDLRRNKRAVFFENQPVLGVNVDAKETERDLYYNVIELREMPYLYRVFTDRQTFWPIPKAEIDKNPNLDQMQGY